MGEEDDRGKQETGDTTDTSDLLIQEEKGIVGEETYRTTCVVAKN